VSNAVRVIARAGPGSPTQARMPGSGILAGFKTVQVLYGSARLRDGVRDSRREEPTEEVGDGRSGCWPRWRVVYSI
jgi:hypothetical protein